MATLNLSRKPVSPLFTLLHFLHTRGQLHAGECFWHCRSFDTASRTTKEAQVWQSWCRNAGALGLLCQRRRNEMAASNLCCAEALQPPVHSCRFLARDSVETLFGHHTGACTWGHAGDRSCELWISLCIRGGHFLSATLVDPLDQLARLSPKLGATVEMTIISTLLKHKVVLTHILAKVAN
jgi:hypothetical protein